MNKPNQFQTLKSENESSKSLINTIVDEKYRLVTKLHSSSPHFDVYLANVIGTHKQVSVKTEKSQEQVLTLRNEHHALMAAESKKERSEEIPRPYWFCKQEDNNFLVCQLVGPSLDNLLKICDKSFTLKTILMLGEQMLKRLEFLHKAGYVHRDIKPQNFCVGLLDKSSRVYLVNLGNAKRYRSSKTGLHNLYSEHKNMHRSSKFSSINTDLGIEQSRRDDLESLIYLLIFFYKGILPWQNVSFKSALEKQARMMDGKMRLQAELLCTGMPDCFATCLKYCKELKYSEKPDYSYLRRLLKTTAGENQITFDGNYDWVVTNRTNENDAKYQFRDMAICFKTPTNISPKAPTNKLDTNIGVALKVEEDYDKIIPDDLGISDFTNEISFPVKALMATVSQSNNSVVYPLNATANLEMDRNISNTGDDFSSLKQVHFKKTDVDNQLGENIKKSNFLSPIVLIEGKKNKPESEANLKVNQTFSKESENNVFSNLKSIETGKKDVELKEHKVSEVNKQNIKKIFKKSSTKDKDEKNCEIF